MSISYQTVIGEDGQPAAALIPWNVFVKLRELIDDEPTPEEIEAANEAEADRLSGNTEAFVPLNELEKELGL